MNELEIMQQQMKEMTSYDGGEYEGQIVKDRDWLEDYDDETLYIITVNVGLNSIGEWWAYFEITDQTDYDTVEAIQSDPMPTMFEAVNDLYIKFKKEMKS